MGNLDRLMAPENHEWLYGEIQRRAQLFELQRADKEDALEAEKKARRAALIEHGFIDREKPFRQTYSNLSIGRY
jgi:hypothetical protein